MSQCAAASRAAHKGLRNNPSKGRLMPCSRVNACQCHIKQAHLVGVRRPSVSPCPRHPRWWSFLSVAWPAASFLCSTHVNWPPHVKSDPPSCNHTAKRDTDSPRSDANGKISLLHSRPHLLPDALLTSETQLLVLHMLRNVCQSCSTSPSQCSVLHRDVESRLRG